MWTLAVWWAANASELLLLLRARRLGILRKYPFFFSYLSFVLAQDVLRFYFYFARPLQYPKFYWSTEILGLLIGMNILWEIYRGALQSFPGALRITKGLFLFVFTIVFFSCVLNVAHGNMIWSPLTTVEMERDLRLVQTALLVAIVVVFRYYSVLIGRNLLGLTIGYGIFLASMLTGLALRSGFGAAFQNSWVRLQPALYLVVLGIWIIAFWNYGPPPLSEQETVPGQDYELAAKATSTKLVRARGSLFRRIRG